MYPAVLPRTTKVGFRAGLWCCLRVLFAAIVLLLAPLLLAPIVSIDDCPRCNASAAGVLGTAETAVAVVKSTTEKVMQALRREKPKTGQDLDPVIQIVDELILPHFDFDRMSTWVLGRYWRTATPDERMAFVREFRRLLVRTYAIALVEHADETVDFLPPRPRPNNEFSVRTVVSQSNGPGIPITYDMYLKNGQWKVFDVSVEGVSLVINYRNSFAAEVKRNGLKHLVDRMRDHNQKGRVENRSG